MKKESSQYEQQRKVNKIKKIALGAVALIGITNFKKVIKQGAPLAKIVFKRII